MTPPAPIAKQVANVAVRAYAAHSYLYYAANESTISDAEYDDLCRWVLENYAWIKPYDINGYLDKSALEAGTGFNIAGKVTGMTLDYARGLLKQHKQNQPKKPAVESGVFA
jgi:hypothetical protein